MLFQNKVVLSQYFNEKIIALEEEVAAQLLNGWACPSHSSHCKSTWIYCLTIRPLLALLQIIIKLYFSKAHVSELHEMFFFKISLYFQFISVFSFVSLLKYSFQFNCILDYSSASSNLPFNVNVGFLALSSYHHSTTFKHLEIYFLKRRKGKEVKTLIKAYFLHLPSYTVPSSYRRIFPWLSVLNSTDTISAGNCLKFTSSM